MPIFKVIKDKLQYDVPVDITQEGDTFVLRFAYNPLLIAEIKAMEKAKWDPKRKVWVVPITERNGYCIRYLMGYRPTNYFGIFDCNDSNVALLNVKRDLFFHQREGVYFALQRKKCMLAFEMGLGKTLTAIELMELSGKSSWWLVAPFGAQQEWKRQLMKWGAKVWPEVFTTYESLQKQLDRCGDIYPQGVILDESIKVKNPNAQRSAAAYELCKRVRETWKDEAYIIALSGAPAPKDPTEWWHQIECIFPGWIREGNIFKFRDRYANIIETDHGYGPHKEVESWKEDELEKLGKRLAPIVLMKKKKDCLDLPSKIFERIECKPSEELLTVANMVPMLGYTGIRTLEILRELSDGFRYSEEVKGDFEWVGSPKVDIVKELLDFYSLENGGPGRLVIYCAFRATVKKLKEICEEQKWNAATISGEGWSNTDILNVFEDENPKENVVIVANPACVHGLTLSKTHALVYYSNTFSVDARIQSLDRRDRPGADKEVATRVIDLLNLPTDLLILEKLNKSMELQSITLEEIKRWLLPKK